MHGPYILQSFINVDNKWWAIRLTWSPKLCVEVWSGLVLGRIIAITFRWGRCSKGLKLFAHYFDFAFAAHSIQFVITNYKA